MKYSVAFDLDGTLVDLPVDIESARTAIGALFAEFGYHEPMRPILDAINRAAASVAGRDEEIYPLIIRARAILDRAEVAAASHAKIRPGAVEAIESLRRLGRSAGHRYEQFQGLHRAGTRSTRLLTCGFCGLDAR